jgi:agmatinase
MTFLRALSGLRIVGADCVEVSAMYDSPGEPTALLAANVVWELLALVAVHRRSMDAGVVPA